MVEWATTTTSFTTFNLTARKLYGIGGDEAAAAGGGDEGAGRVARQGAAAEGMEGKGRSAVERSVVGGLGRAGGGKHAAADGSAANAQERARFSDSPCFSCALASEGPRMPEHAPSANYI